jgi:hypothetical protein
MRHQWAAGPGGDRDVGAPGDIEEDHGVARRLFDIDVSEDGGDRFELELGRLEQEEQRHGVVDTGICIENDASGHRLDHPFAVYS